MNLLVTGADGFVGRRVFARLSRAGRGVVAGARQSAAIGPDGVVAWQIVGAVDATTHWWPALQDVDAVVHLVASKRRWARQRKRVSSPHR